MRIKPEGMDLEWFAVDRDGHLGFFTSNGSRILPEPVLRSWDAWQWIRQTMKTLPRPGVGTLVVTREGNQEDWIEMAARGLFAYDFNPHDPAMDEEGDYQRIATPSQALIVDALDERIRRELAAVTMKTLCFAETEGIGKDRVLAL